MNTEPSPEPAAPRNQPVDELLDAALPSLPPSSAYGELAFPAAGSSDTDVRDLTPSGDVISVRDTAYVASISPLIRTGRSSIRLKDFGDAFVELTPSLDIIPSMIPESGFFFDNTRFLSRFEIFVDGVRPDHVGTVTNEDGTSAESHLTVVLRDAGNPKLHIHRTTFVHHGTWHQRFHLTNSSPSGRSVKLTCLVHGDFADLFELRGIRRERRGVTHPSKNEAGALVFTYLGLDDCLRTTHICSVPAGDSPRPGVFEVTVFAPARGAVSLDISVQASMEGKTAPIENTFASSLGAKKVRQRELRSGTVIVCCDERVNSWLEQSWVDLTMLASETAHGYYPYAGLPWFNTKFGRDGILSALMVLPFQPSLARAVLQYLAANIATESDPFRAAEPGKVLHEVRGGEMARLDEVAFGRYYGSADATPLAVHLAAEYLRQTGDIAFICSLWPAIEAQLAWIERAGGENGLVGYTSSGPKGLTHQSWRDSVGAVFHADGSDAPEPIVSCELPPYVYAAKHGGAYIASALGLNEQARKLTNGAHRVAQKFDELFWSNELGSYGLALDGDARLCAVRASSAGHALFTGIASPEKAAVLAQTLFERDLFSGWGIRTVSTRASRFDPLSYHNGSVWPHDNALIGYGLGRYGYTKQVERLFTPFLLAAAHNGDVPYRLPELLTGHDRGNSRRPIPYPVACSPQAWAAASVFALLRGMLGLEIDGVERKISLNNPYLPPYFGQRLRFENLRVGGAHMDLTLERGANNRFSAHISGDAATVVTIR